MSIFTRVLVIADGEPPSPALFHNLAAKHDQLVAVDGGLHVCLGLGIEPDVLIGDFDSVSQEIRQGLAKTLQIFAPDQDKSDLEKTLEYLFQNGNAFTTVTVCGASGKRLDHTLTNICLLCRYPGRLKFESDTEWCMALSSPSNLATQVGDVLSLIPVNTVHNVVTHGLKWELEEVTLDKNFVSISNVCLGESVAITFSSGDLVACFVKLVYKPAL